MTNLLAITFPRKIVEFVFLFRIFAFTRVLTSFFMLRLAYHRLRPFMAQYSYLNSPWRLPSPAQCGVELSLSTRWLLPFTRFSTF
jgi:hypothetical protein